MGYVSVEIVPKVLGESQCEVVAHQLVTTEEFTHRVNGQEVLVDMPMNPFYGSVSVVALRTANRPTIALFSACSIGCGPHQSRPSPNIP
jgi:hypothetical protein